MRQRETKDCKRCKVGTEIYTIFVIKNKTFNICSDCCCEILQAGWEDGQIKDSFIKSALTDKNQDKR